MARIYSHRRNSFGNQKKALPMEAMYAAGVSGFSLLVYVIIIAVSVYMAGETPNFIGGLGIIFFLVSLVAFIYNVGQMRTQTELRDRVVCMVISSISLLAWLITFFIGMF